jgi:hypothetical protein
MSATLRTIVNESEQLIGEVAGVGVQQYSEDTLFRHAIRAFDMLFKKYHWPNYRKWYTVTLDGTTGVITADTFERVIDFEDFISVHRSGESTPLPTLPKGRPPSTITGTRSLYWTSMHVADTNYVKRKLQIYPLAATGSLDVQARVYPIPVPAIDWDWDNDTIYLDKSMMVYATSFMALIANALNPDAANTCKSLMETQYNNITNGLADSPIAIEHSNSVPDQWYVQP